MKTISIELFKELYELGFKMERVQKLNDKPVMTFSSSLYDDEYSTVWKKKRECIAYYIPTTTEVVEFLRKKYNLFIDIKIKIADPFSSYSYQAVHIFDIYRIKCERDSDEIILLYEAQDSIKSEFYDRYDAEEAAIEYCLTNLI